MNKILIPAFLLLGACPAFSQSPPTAPATPQNVPGTTYNFTTVTQLKQAIAWAIAHIADPETRDQTRDYVIKQWLDNRMITAAGYRDTLNQALDAWYANNNNWRKIPDDTWSQLSERDRGRIKDNIDPELRLYVHAAPAATKLRK